MDSSNAKALKEFLESQLSRPITNKELMVEVNKVRASTYEGFAYESFNNLLYAVYRNEALYEFKAFKSPESWQSDFNQKHIEHLTKPKPSPIWFTYDELSTVYETGYVETKTGVTVKEKSWDKKTYEDTAKDKKEAKQKIIDEYKRVLKDLTARTGDTVEIDMKVDVV